MSRPRSESGGPVAAASNRRRRALTLEDLPNEMKLHIRQYVRVAFTNEGLRRAVAEYFAEDDEGARPWDPPALADAKRPRRLSIEKRFGKIGTWDVGRVTDMSQLFKGRRRFNADISAWDTSSVTNMSNMLAGSTYYGPGLFTRDIGGWDTYLAV